MKFRMVPISVICYILFVCCEVSEVVDPIAEETSFQQEQVDPDASEEAGAPSTEEESEEESEEETAEAPPEETEAPAPPETAQCITDGGRAGDTGLKVWCWEDIDIPEYSDSKGVALSDGQLKIDSECSEEQVSKAGDKIKFHVNPLVPEVGSWCSRQFNMRAEVRTAPWNVQHSLGTEEWFGWTYTFGNNYKVDQENQWLFFQVHPGISGLSPQIELSVINQHQFSGHEAGEIYVMNKGNYPDNHPTGIRPQAGQTLNIVVHVIWGNASNGLLQVWIDGNKVYDKQVATVYADYPWGGNAKWGIYKWPWINSARIDQSLSQGINDLETYMGTLRILTRKPGDPMYMQDAYSQVSPE